MIFDTHCHYNLSPLYENWSEHWQKAQQHGVTKALIPSANLESSRRAIEIAQEETHLYAAIGIHPHEYNSISAADLPTYIYEHAASLSILQDRNKVVAIGETGLDYYRLEKKYRTQSIANQKEGLKLHIQLANEYDKILIIHARDKGGNKDENNQAYWDILEIIKKHYQFKKPLVLHCVSGPKAYIKKMIQLGAFFGVGGNVSYSSANELREIIKMIPPDKLLLETDAPYLPPHKFRGQICEPWMISLTAEYLNKQFGFQASKATAILA